MPEICTIIFRITARCLLSRIQLHCGEEEEAAEAAEEEDRGVLF